MSVLAVQIFRLIFRFPSIFLWFGTTLWNRRNSEATELYSKNHQWFFIIILSASQTCILCCLRRFTAFVAKMSNSNSFVDKNHTGQIALTSLWTTFLWNMSFLFFFNCFYRWEDETFLITCLCHTFLQPIWVKPPLVSSGTVVIFHLTLSFWGVSKKTSNNVWLREYQVQLCFESEMNRVRKST